MKPAIAGAHVMIFSRDAETDRAFFRDVLGLDSVDSGGGWLIFALPPADEARWGRVTEITLPGGGRIGLYQPKHPLAHAKTG